MKRVLTAALIVLCAFGLFGCGSGDDAAAKKGESRHLKVGVKNNVQGFGYQDPITNSYAGLEIDLANKIAESLGYSGVEFTAVTAATRTELLDSGTIDCVLATFTITPARKESWDFTTPYYTDAVTVLVEKSSGITNLAGLVGKTVGVSTSSTSAKAVASAMATAGLIDDFDREADFTPSSFSGGVKFMEFPDYPAISNALQAGTVDAFSVDKSILATYLNNNRQYIDEKFSPQEYGVATKKGSALSAQIEGLITTWLSDGTIDKLVANYNLQ